MATADVKTIISIIDVLTSGQDQDARIQMEVGSTFTLVLQQRLSWFAEKVSADGDLRRIISLNAPHLLRPESSENCHLHFLDHCISLLIVLKDLLDALSLAATSLEPEGPSHHSEAPPAPPNCLSVLQKKTVQGLVQFVVAIGINPNLLPGVGLPLEQRTVSSVPNCSACLLPWQKHRYLVASVRALLMCTQSPELCSMVLHHHLVDILAALLQLCYAPIRKIADGRDDIKFDLNSASLSSTVPEVASSLAKCRASAPADDISLIQEMWEDRQYLTLDLQRLLETTYQPIIVRELLLLLSSASQLKAKGVPGVKSTPQWLKDICGQLLTQCLLRKGGLSQVILGTFDAWSVDSSGGVVSETDWQKCETFAKIVARVPSRKGVTVESYYEGISSQVVELFLQPQGSSMDKVAFRIACATVGAMLEEQPEQTSRLVLGKIFSPLFICINEQSASLSENDMVVPEEDLGKCIELIHKMVSCVDPNHPLLTALVPWFSLLFEITVATQGTVSYLRVPCEEILGAVYHSQPVKSAIELMHRCLFKTDCCIPLVTPREDVAFKLGGSGGIQAIRRLSPLNVTEWLCWADGNCNAVASVFHHGNLKEPCAKFFVSLLKKLTAAVGELKSKEPTDPLLQHSYENYEDAMNSQEVKDMLLLFCLVEGFAEFMSDALMQNKLSLLEFVVETLNRVSQLSESLEMSILAMQSTLFSLTLIGLLISAEDMAAAKNEELWKLCYQHLVSLEANHSSPEVRDLARGLQVSLASQGVVPAPQTSHSTSIAGGPSRTDGAAHEKKLAAIAAGFNILSIGSCHSRTPLDSQTVGQQQEVDSTRVAAAAESSGVLPPPARTAYEQLWCELHDAMVPIRGHAFIQLRRMLLENNAEVWQHQDQLLEVCRSGIQDEDSYIYLSAIQALAVFVDRDSDCLLPWLAEQLSLEKLSVEARLNLGEVLLRVTKNLGDMAPKYRDLLVNSFLCAAKHPDPVIRSSAVSNLGELCGKLGYSFAPIMQEILACLRGLVRDSTDFVCHAAVLALGCVIKGMGQKIFQVMPHEVKDIYRELKHLYDTTSDNVTKIQAQVAIDELSAATRELLQSQPHMEKHIQILDLFKG